MEKSAKQTTANVTSLFFLQAELHPDTIALIDREEKTTSFGELAQEVIRTAAALKAKGIEKGDRVLIFIPMSIDLYRVVLALFYLGATAVFLDEWVNKKRLALCCELVSCKAMIGSRKALFLTWFLAPLRKLPIRLTPDQCTDNQTIPQAEVSPEDTALITFTTGSTGTPKAADRSHAFLRAQFEALQSEINPQHGDVAMPVLPIVLLINLGAGATSVIADFPARKPEKMKPSVLYQQIQRHQVSRITSSPFVVDRLATWMQAEEKQCDSVRQVFTGGAPVFPAMATNLSQAFSAEIRVVFGSTEAEPISMASSTEVINRHLPGKGLYVGDIYEGCDLRIIPITNGPIGPMTKDEFDKLPLPALETGEIVVSGNHVLKKYIDNPEAWFQNKIEVDGTIWHRTGDGGFLDTRGCLFLVGRASRIIFSEGRMIAPFLIEQELASIPGISIGTVIQGKDALTLVLESTHKHVSALSQEFLSSVGLPEHIRIRHLRAIPRDPRHNGKIDYGKLEKLI